ncbi:MAG: TetR/AcrR family transcriptional regulator [Ktedonobacteraceae bacterium]|nr:TetR/AcrR family transcriptional regulator [Ktedonobacteraceae bacterium]
MQRTSQEPRSLREKQRREREMLILGAAEEVLLEKGYHETSMDEIAARVGVAKGTIYLHFPSKEDLVIAIFARDMERFSQAIEDAIRSQQTAREKLESLLTFMYCGYFSRRARLFYLLYNNVDMKKLFVEKGGCMQEMWEQLTQKISAVLEEGKAAGEFTRALPTSVMLSAFSSLVSPKNYERLVVNEQMPPEEVARYLSQIYFKGIESEG